MSVQKFHKRWNGPPGAERQKGGLYVDIKRTEKIVKVADVEKRIPSVKSLKEHKVVVKEMINADTTISVYDHGYVLYTAGNQSTVFPLHSCDDYEYVSVTGDNKEFNKEFFDNENWYIRLLMEAEDRMAYSQSKISTNHGCVFSNSDVTDDAEIMRGSSKDFARRCYRQRNSACADQGIDREAKDGYSIWFISKKCVSRMSQIIGNQTAECK